MKNWSVQVEAGLTRRRRAPVAPRHQRWRAPRQARGPAQRGTEERAVHGAPRAPGQREGLPHREVPLVEHGAGRGPQRSGVLARRPDPDVDRRRRGAADQGQPVSVRTERGDGDTGLRQRRRRPAPAPTVRIQRDERVPARRRHTRHDRAVNGLGHGVLAEHPVGAVELCLHVGQPYRLLLRARETRVHVGLPPTAAVRHEAQRPVASPGGLADRLAGTAGHGQCGAVRLERVVTVARPGDAGQRHDHDERRIPRHVRMVPGDHGQPVTGRMRAGRPEEVVPVEQRGLARLRAAGGQGDDAAHRAGRSHSLELPDREDPVAVRRRAEPTVVVHLAPRG